MSTIFLAPVTSRCDKSTAASRRRASPTASSWTPSPVVGHSPTASSTPCRSSFTRSLSCVFFATRCSAECCDDARRRRFSSLPPRRRRLPAGTASPRRRSSTRSCARPSGRRPGTRPPPAPVPIASRTSTSTSRCRAAQPPPAPSRNSTTSSEFIDVELDAPAPWTNTCCASGRRSGGDRSRP